MIYDMNDWNWRVTSCFSRQQHFPFVIVVTFYCVPTIEHIEFPVFHFSYLPEKVFTWASWKMPCVVAKACAPALIKLCKFSLQHSTNNSCAESLSAFAVCCQYRCSKEYISSGTVTGSANQPFHFVFSSSSAVKPSNKLVFRSFGLFSAYVMLHTHLARTFLFDLPQLTLT